MTGLVDSKCREMVELVTEYLSEALPAEELARFEQHLFTCPPCTAYLQQMKALIALSSALPEPPSPPASQTLDVFRRWRRREP